MKKFLITLLLVMAVACLFTVVASAKTLIFVDETGNEMLTCLTEGSNDYPIESYSGSGFPKYDADGDALTWYRKSSKTIETGVVQYTVTCAKTKDLVTDNGDGILTQSEISQYSNLVSITFDANCGITEFGNNSADGGLFHRTDSARLYLLFVNIPDSVTKLSKHCFRNAVRLLNVGMSENSKIADLGEGSFYGCVSMKSIYIPKGVTTLKTDYALGDDKYWRTGLFRNCQKLENVIFASDSKLAVIEKGAFNDCKSLKTITLPNSVKTLHPRVFAKCPALEYVNFGGGLVEFVRDRELGDEYVSMFQNSTKLKTVILPATFKAENLADDLHTSFSISGITVYYAGTSEEFVKLQQKFALAKNGSGNGGITKAEYNYISPCEAFYNGHAFDIDCTTADACANGCGTTMDKYDSHNMSEAIEYPNGFASTGILYSGCLNPNCQPLAQTTAPAIFIMNEHNGFSESGKDGIAFGGYCLNATALDEYNRVNKDAPVKYGVVLINPDYLDGQDSFFVNGKVNSTTENKGFLQTDMSSARYANISISVTGFTGKAENLSIILAIYAYTDANDVEFIQSQTTECASEKVTLGETSLYTVTLASVKAGNSNLLGLGDYVMPSKREQQA